MRCYTLMFDCGEGSWVSRVHGALQEPLLLSMYCSSMQLYLAQYEGFPLQLSRSSCQPVPLKHLLSLADQDIKQQWEQLELGYPPNVGSKQLRQVGPTTIYPSTCLSVYLSIYLSIYLSTTWALLGVLSGRL